jgi:predicted GNAT family N-acyltransferase
MIGIMGKIIGYCIARKSEDYMIIDNLIIHQNYRQQGLGKQLLKIVLGYYPSHKFVLLCEDYNKSFYEKFGFVPTTNITFTDKNITNFVMILNTNNDESLRTSPAKISYYGNGLIHNGGLTPLSLEE